MTTLKSAKSLINAYRNSHPHTYAHSQCRRAFNTTTVLNHTHHRKGRRNRRQQQLLLLSSCSVSSSYCASSSSLSARKSTHANAGGSHSAQPSQSQSPQSSSGVQSLAQHRRQHAHNSSRGTAAAILDNSNEVDLRNPRILGYKLFTWGETRKSSLGLGSPSDPNTDTDNGDAEVDSTLEGDRDTSFPIEMPGIDSSGILSVSSSLNSTGIVTGNGDIFMYGYSDYGQLGLSSNTSVSASITADSTSRGLNALKNKTKTQDYKQLIRTPTKIQYHNNNNNNNINTKTVHFVQIACGNRHSAAIDEDGRLYTWGWNGSLFTCSALGHGYNKRRALFSFGSRGGGGRTAAQEQAQAAIVLYPTLVESMLDHRVVQVSCGDKHTLALTADGEIYAFGYGEHGRLGTGHTSSYSTPTKLSYFDDIPMRFICAAKEYSFAISARSQSQSIDGGNRDGDGDGGGGGVGDECCIPYGWGRNDRNQMGIGGGLAMDMYSCDPTPQPINIQRIVDLGLSDMDVIAVDDGGSVYHWGDRVFLSPNKINNERELGTLLLSESQSQSGGEGEQGQGQGQGHAQAQEAQAERIQKVDITSSMMCFVSNYGKVYTCSKTFGMKSDICSLGQGSVEPYKIAKQVQTLDEEFITDVVCSDGKCIAIAL